jgi:hypothetical protein
MKSWRVYNNRETRRKWLRLAAAALATPLLAAPLSQAQSGGAPVMRVEEDWEALLNEPDDGVVAPQFHTIISPIGDAESLYYQACWNYREQPDFVSGGMQLFVYSGDGAIGQKSVREDPLSTMAETITWTQSMSTTGAQLIFVIKEGQSSQWGSFGGWETRLAGSVAVPNLNGYSPEVSTNSSWVSYGANRVDLLRIKEVRYYDGEGNLLARDSSSRVVYQLDQ